MVPLRHRQGDILELANYFLAQLNQTYHQSIVLSSEVKRSLGNYQWPGNIRELDNVIKAAYATCDGFSIDMIDLPARLVNLRQEDELGLPGSKKLANMMESYERGIIKSTLRETGGNCQRAADELGIHRSALYKKMAKLNIHRHKENIYE